MSGLSLTLLIAGIYVLGVMVALVFIAVVNANEKDNIIEVPMACLSWAMVVLIILVIVGFFVSRPFNWFYERLKAFIERK